MILFENQGNWLESKIILGGIGNLFYLIDQGIDESFVKVQKFKLEFGTYLCNYKDKQFYLRLIYNKNEGKSEGVWLVNIYAQAKRFQREVMVPDKFDDLFEQIGNYLDNYIDDLDPWQRGY